MKIHHLSIALIALLISPAYAQQETEQQNTDTPAILDCPFPSLTNTYGSRVPSLHSIPLATKVELGKEHSEGSIIYYTEYKDAAKFYLPGEDIKITNPSPLNPTQVFSKGIKLITQATFISKADGKAYDLVRVRDYAYFLIDENGMICNGGYNPSHDWSMNNLFKWTTPPHSPLKPVIEQSQTQAQTNTIKAIAIQLVKADDLQTTLQISRIIDDRIIESKRINVNSIKGKPDIGGINLKFHLQGKNLVLDEVNEPASFSLVAYKLFGRQ